MRIQVSVDNLSNVPYRGSQGAAGLDLHPAHEHIIAPGATELVGTGLRLAIPVNYAGLVLERSSLCGIGLSLANKVGLIDSDYRGELLLKLHNTTDREIRLYPEMRLAQLVIVRVPVFQWEIVKELDETTRGSGGFGSTGL